MNRVLFIILLVIIILGGAGYFIFPFIVGALKALIGFFFLLLIGLGIGFGIYLNRRFSKKQ
jgi:hypothetical protein